MKIQRKENKNIITFQQVLFNLENNIKEIYNIESFTSKELEKIISFVKENNFLELNIYFNFWNDNVSKIIKELKPELIGIKNFNFNNLKTLFKTKKKLTDEDKNSILLNFLEKYPNEYKLINSAINLKTIDKQEVIDYFLLKLEYEK